RRVTRGLAREAPAVSMGEIEKVIAVPRGPNEVAIFAETVQTVDVAKPVPARRGFRLRMELRRPRSEMGPEDEAHDENHRAEPPDQRRETPRPAGGSGLHPFAVLALRQIHVHP